MKVSTFSCLLRQMWLMRCWQEAVLHRSSLDDTTFRLRLGLWPEGEKKKLISDQKKDPVQVFSEHHTFFISHEMLKCWKAVAAFMFSSRQLPFTWRVSFVFQAEEGAGDVSIRGTRAEERFAQVRDTVPEISKFLSSEWCFYSFHFTSSRKCYYREGNLKLFILRVSLWIHSSFV